MHIRKPLPEELPSKRQLLTSSVIALLAAALLITTVVLPAERGIDVTGIGEQLHLTRMGQIKVAMSEADAPLDGRPTTQDQITLTLESGQGQEIKMEMKKGYEVAYSWSTDGAPVSHDTHGDPYANESIFISYTKADAANEDSGTITAVYGGHHGWYWVNNGPNPVTITLQTEGQYLNLLAK